MGTSTKLRMSESAQKSAVVAMRRVDQPPPAVVEWVSCELCMCVEVAMPASVSSIRTIPLALESHRSAAYSRVAGFGVRGRFCPAFFAVARAPGPVTASGESHPALKLSGRL